MNAQRLQPRLIIIEGKDKGKAIGLRSGTNVLGRSKADIIIPDPRMSRSHVVIHFDENMGTLSFTDLKSLNGTLLNGKSAESGELRDGDKLQLGNTLLDCQLKPDEWERSISISIRPPEPVVFEAAPAPSASASNSTPEPKDYAQTDSQSREEVNKKLIKKKPGYLETLQRLPTPFKIVLALCVLGFMVSFMMPKKKSSSSTFSRVEELELEGKPNKALALAEKLLGSENTDAKTFQDLGAYFEKQGRYEPALMAYQQAAHATPPQPVSIVRLISLLLRAGRKEAAQEELNNLDEVLKDGPFSKELFVEAAQLFLEYEDQLQHAPEKALILAKGLQTEVAPDSSIGYKLEAQALLKQQRPLEAYAAMEKGLHRSPQDEWLLEHLVILKLNSKDNAGAEKTLNDWIASNPKNARPQLITAYLRFRQKDYLSAAQTAQSILQMSNSDDNHHKEALFLLGQIYFNQGQIENAQNYLRKACEAGVEASCSHPGLGNSPTDRATATPAERAPAEPTE